MVPNSLSCRRLPLGGVPVGGSPIGGGPVEGAPVGVAWIILRSGDVRMVPRDRSGVFLIRIPGRLHPVDLRLKAGDVSVDSAIWLIKDTIMNVDRTQGAGAGRRLLNARMIVGNGLH